MSLFKLFILLINIIFVINRYEDIEENTKLGNFYHINDYTYKDLVSNYTSNNSWLLIFYDKSCPYSKGALINLKRDILKYYQYNKTLKFGIIDVENQNCIRLVKRFQVKRVPYTTFIKKDKMYPYTEIFTPGRIIDFINGLNVSNYKLVPEDPYEKFYENEKNLSFYEQSKENFFEYINSFNKPITEFLDKFSFNIKWTNNKTYFAFILFLILLGFCEYYLILFILRIFGFKFNKEIVIKTNNNNKDKLQKENKESLFFDKKENNKYKDKID